MTPGDIELVKTSFQAIVPMKEAAAALFYKRLFEIDPALRDLFPADMAGQGLKLMTALAFAVRGLERPQTILPVLEGLGRRHAFYGVEERDYATVGQALVETLDAAMGEEFTPELRAAWIAAYMLLSGAMIEAARQAKVAA
ncbi:globin family protein [Lutibaculum baratangense]|uniref:Putative bacterial hemoglobin n=1 Tax=Lutibaculum baratangense AMV1 TaxID=631454 RepID=V4R4D1_9HYPH|nr:globin family protein [Lutibaculum baratangense]ESR26812.1 putative bacterial hemoglobin [Lutibaculum baratangense AMV1]